MTPQELNRRIAAATAAAKNAASDDDAIAAIRREMRVEHTDRELRTELLALSNARGIGDQIETEIEVGTSAGALAPEGYPHWGWIIRIDDVIAGVMYLNEGDDPARAYSRLKVRGTIVAFYQD